MTAPPLPVTVISGLAGTGKRALLARLAAQPDARRVAVLRTTDETLRAELVHMARNGLADVIVIDARPEDEPMSIAESLMLEDEAGETLEAFVTVDTMVTVIEAASFLDGLASADGLAERGLDDGGGDRTVGELLIEQVEFCDVFAIDPSGETAPIDSHAIERLQSILAKLNPRAVQIVADPADVPVDALLATGRFDAEATASAPGWLSALDPSSEASPDDPEAPGRGAGHPARHRDQGRQQDPGTAAQPADTPSVDVFVYRARRPFHPARFFALLHEAWPGILRSKGLFWIATRNDMAGSLSQVGGTCRHGPAGFWWAAQPADEWPDDEAFKAEIAHDWLASPDAHGRETVGDRRQELVMIGIDIDRDAWQHKFDACLLSDAEWLLKTDGSALFEDPFPQWDEDHEHGEDH
ncbi:MAG: GTP-binding protein [Pararobbsia sp.]